MKLSDFFRKEANQIDLLKNKVEKNPKLLEAIERLGKTKDWEVLQEFVLSEKVAEGELALFSDESFEEVKGRRKYIQGWIDIMKLPHIVNEIRKEAKEKKERSLVEKAKRLKRKYNPGT